MQPVLVWGRHGLLAQALRRNCSLQSPVVFWGRSELPVSRIQQTHKILHLRPSAIVNASGFTDLKSAERSPLAARALHVDLPAYLATMSRDLNIPFVTLSSDYVFSGEGQTEWRESDPTGPINAYGKTKREGERAVLAAYPETKIIRTCGLFGPAPAGSKMSFPEKVWRQALAGRIPEVRSDLVTSICHVDDLAKDLWQILWGSSGGIFHVTHRGGATWLAIAQFALKAAGVSGQLQPLAQPDFPRPPCSTLTSLWAETRGGYAGRKTWQEALEGFMKNLRYA